METQKQQFKEVLKGSTIYLLIEERKMQLYKIIKPEMMGEKA